MKNKIGMIAVIGLLVIMLAAVGVGLFITINSLNKIQGNQGEEGNQAGVTYNVEDLVTYNVTDPIKANLSTGNDNLEHLCLVSISLAVNSKEKGYDKFIVTLGEKEIIIRDVALKVLRDKRIDDFKKSDAQQSIGDEILANLQEEFNTNMIVDVYFGEFFYD